MSYYQAGQPQYPQGQHPPPQAGYQPGQYPQGQQPPPQAGYQPGQYSQGQQPPPQAGYQPGYPPGQGGAQPMQGGYQHGGWGGQPGMGGVDPNIAQWFQAVDRDRTGKISPQELQTALTNSNWSKFNIDTCKMMVGMFDRDRSGQIDINEFQALWNYIHQWKSIFDRFDSDRSGSIDANELNSAFAQLGFRVSSEFCHGAVMRYDISGQARVNFDAFIHCCVLIRQVTDKFRSKDTSGQGVMQVGYEEYLSAVVLNRI